MPTGIDHIVIAVDDLDTATRDFTAAGFTVTPGGEHKGGASANVLVTFQDGAYFELIAFRVAQGGYDAWRTLLQKAGEGFVDFALRTNDLDAELASLRSHGLDAQDPQSGGRFRPDGQRLDWRTLRFGPGDSAALPFYCVDETDRALRVPGGEAAVHANGVTGVSTVRIVVADLSTAGTQYAALTGADGMPFNAGDDAVAGAIRFPIGTAGAVVELLEPAPGENPLRAQLAARGEKPYEVVLTGTGRTDGLLPLDETHGARLIVATR
ncbi:MAG: VOC family protein [Thermomicrobiales bacterium]